MYHKDPETDSARIVGFEVTPNRFCHIHFQLFTLFCRNPSRLFFLFFAIGNGALVEVPSSYDNRFVFHYMALLYDEINPVGKCFIFLLNALSILKVSLLSF